MKVFRFIKKNVFLGLTILSNLTNASSLSCISMNNQECKARPQIVIVNSNNPIFYPFFLKQVLKQVNLVVIVIIHMQEFVFLIL